MPQESEPSGSREAQLDSKLKLLQHHIELARKAVQNGDVVPDWLLEVCNELIDRDEQFREIRRKSKIT